MLLNANNMDTKITVPFVNIQGIKAYILALFKLVII